MAAFATVELNVTGNLLPIARAFGIMSAALAAYGHEFSSEDAETIAEAAERISESAQLESTPDLDSRSN